MPPVHQGPLELVGMDSGSLPMGPAVATQGQRQRLCAHRVWAWPGLHCNVRSSPGKKQTQQRSVCEDREGALTWFQTTDPEGTELVAHGPQGQPTTSKQLNPHTALRLPVFGGIPGALASVSATDKITCGDWAGGPLSTLFRSDRRHLEEKSK